MQENDVFGQEIILRISLKYVFLMILKQLSFIHNYFIFFQFLQILLLSIFIGKNQNKIQFTFNVKLSTNKKYFSNKCGRFQ